MSHRLFLWPGALLMLTVLAGAARPQHPATTLPAVQVPPLATLLPPRGATEAALELPPPRIVPPGAAICAPLGLEEVLASVDQFYPLLLAAQEERGIAEGKLLSSQGVFDTNLRANENVINGSYDSHRLNVGLEQATPFLGLSTFAGYRFGAGNYPSYYGYLKTAEGGEFRAGVNLPLLRDRQIDKRRAGLQQAELTRLLADPLVQRARIDYFRAAAKSFWGWTAAGQRLQLTRQLLRVAQERNQALRVLAEKGQIKGIEVTDNERTITERQARLVTAERRLQQTAIELSLYLRDLEGNPCIPASERLPSAFPEPTAPDLHSTGKLIQTALEKRPEVRRFRLLRERTQVDLDLAHNQMLPGVNVVLTGAQDVGAGKKDLDRQTYEAAVVVDVPLQRRDARGKIQTAQATLSQLGVQERYLVDVIGAEVTDANLALERGLALIEKLRENVRLARLVEQGEQERLRLGATTVLLVNLRELATFEAEALLVDGLLEYFRAQADLRAALGVDAHFVPGGLHPHP